MSAATFSPELGRLDLDGLDEHGRVLAIQRARLLAATSQIVCEHGAGNVSVAQIVERAGVSRRTFYEIFSDWEDCLLATLQDALDRAHRRVLPVWRSRVGWRERVRDSLVELLALFDEEPAVAQLLLVESLSAGRRALERRSQVIEALIDAIDDGREQARRDAEPTRLDAEGALGGVLAVLYARIERGAPGRLVELAGPLMAMLVLPYQGPAVARREVERPVPARTHRPREEDSPLRSDPFKDAGMRLTYRTMRVLNAIAEHPGASNRQIGQLAQMSDQGQASKLLARLERLGMIANDSAGHARGEPNAWTLTGAGRQVTESIRVHTERASA